MFPFRFCRIFVCIFHVIFPVVLKHLFSINVVCCVFSLFALKVHWLLPFISNCKRVLCRVANDDWSQMDVYCKMIKKKRTVYGDRCLSIHQRRQRLHFSICSYWGVYVASIPLSNLSFTNDVEMKWHKNIEHCINIIVQWSGINDVIVVNTTCNIYSFTHEHTLCETSYTIDICYICAVNYTATYCCRFN